VDRMSNKQKPKVPDSLKGMKNKKDQVTLMSAVYGLIKFVEIGNSAIKKVQNEQRQCGKADMFRLQCNIDFAIGIILNYFGLEPSFIQTMADDVAKEEDFEEEVGKFADKLAPNKSILVTDNIQQEFRNVSLANKFSKGA